MGDTYNNVGATGLIAQSNHYCPVIMGDNIICWRLDGDETGVCGMCIGGTNNRYWTIRCWTTVIGSGVVGPGDQTGRPYIFIWVDVWCTTYIIWRGGTNIIGPTIVGPSVIGPGDQTGRPYIRGGGHYWIAFWQNVKRRGLQCPSSHQNTIWWIRRAFSSQNTDWCRQGCWNNIPEGVGNGWVSFFLFLFPYIPLFITFRFVDSTLLLENETHFFLLPFSKDWTSGRETMVFGRWNYIVWGGKLYCLARETILFRARFVCFSKMKRIVF